MRRVAKFLGGTALGFGLVAGSNKILRQDSAQIDPPLGRQQETYRWRGFDIAYTEAGDPSNPDLLLLHGVSAVGSSHEFRYCIDALVEDFHIVAPDMPGFGHSDRPPLLYSSSLYVSFITDIIRDLVDNPTIVGVSLTGGYCALATAETTEPVNDLYLVCPTTDIMGDPQPFARALLRSPVLGEAFFNLIVSKPAIRYFLADHGFADKHAIPQEWVDYDWHISHQSGSRFAPASFLTGYLNLDIDLADTLAGVSSPVTLIWGSEVTSAPLEIGKTMAESADVRLLCFDNTALLPHAEHPREFVALLQGENEPYQKQTV